MPLDWSKLKISQTELDSACEFSIFDNWAIALSRLLLLRQPEYWQQLLLAEISVWFLSILLLFPINLMLFRKLNLLSSSGSGLFLVLLVSLLLSGLLILLFNYYLWQQAKQLKLIAKLLNKVVGHNQLIENFQLLANIERLSSDRGLNNGESIVELNQTLQVTKDSLLKGIELEGFIYHHQREKNKLYNYNLNRDRLLTNLEENLVNLSLPETDSDREYQALLSEAVEIATSVHREMRRSDRQ